MSSELAVLRERRARTLVVTLNRPDARNAVNEALAQGLAAALDELDDDPDLAVGVLAGAGRGFCAGMDLKAFVAGERSEAGDRGFAGIVERPPRKPLIAAVEGFALAGGLEVALACDVIVAGEGAILGLPEVRRGLVPSAGGLRRLPQRVPYGVAMELALSGVPISAERAHAVGLVDRLTPAGSALEVALELAATIAAAAPLAVVATKQVLAEQHDWTDAQFWSRQQAMVAPVMSSADALEGATAFAEKRDPTWRGR